MRIRTVVAAACVLALAGCGSTASAHTQPKPVSLDEHDNGRTVHVAIGADVTVTLHSSYWTFAPVAAAGVLHAVGAPTVAGGLQCAPGMGCGTVTAHFTAAAAGTARVDAGRTSCGEAMACGPGQGAYEVIIEVDK